MNQLASQNAPSPLVVVPHYIFGGITLLFVTILLILNPSAFTQHYFNPTLLAITHLLALGWMSMIIFGALYQLIPVILEVKLFSEKLAFYSFALMGTGVILLAYSFWQFSFGTVMVFSGSLVVISVLLFVINVLVTAAKSDKKNMEKVFIITSAIWLLFTVLAGLILALNFTRSFLSPTHIELLKLHAHAGIVGWFLQLIIGVSSRLLPMFMVSHGLNTKKLTFAYFLINSGLIMGLISIYHSFQLGVIIGVITGVLGAFTYLSFLFEAYKKRIKKQLDIGMKQSALSFIFLVVPLFLIFILLWDFKALEHLTPPLSIAYGSFIFFGFITSLIMGQTYKTLPFIMWLKVYRGKIGKLKLPLPKDLYSEKIAIAQVWFFATGFLLLLVGILTTIKAIVMISGITLFLSVALYNLNIFKIILHQPKKI